MSQATRKWTRNELVAAFNLYCKTPFGRIHNRNPEIIELATALHRTPSALSWKLANFSRLDPAIAARSLRGATHGAKLEVEIWNEFNSDWDRLAFESEKIRAEFEGRPIGEESKTFPEGTLRESTVKVRVNQAFFRSAVLAAYGNKCCITGLCVPELLNASHIIPWATEAMHRTNPRNGLCLNALHDRAFDRGLISFDSEMRLVVSPRIRTMRDDALQRLVLSDAGSTIRLPAQFQPEPSFLAFHFANIFQASVAN